ncbi:MAG: hypothetical protein KC502_04745 [Myxococcales bacterium]|nr:hypothetical protein [Myxococcales bacterium]
MKIVRLAFLILTLLLPAANAVAAASENSAKTLNKQGKTSNPAETNAAAKATQVRLVNVGPGVTVRIDGGQWIPLRRGQSTTVRTSKKTLHYTVARGDLWQYSAQLDLHDVLQREVQLVPPGGHLKVVNRSGENRTITWGGAVLGILKRGQTRLMGPLAPGTQPIHATGQRSRDIYARRVTLAHGATAEVVLPPVSAGLVIPNPLTEPARLRVDFEDYGELQPRERVTVLGLAPGDHKVELIGRRSGKLWSYNSQLGVRGASPPQPGALTIVVDNATGEDLRLIYALSGLHNGPIRAGEKVKLQVARKTFRLAATGVRSGLPYVFDVRPRAGGLQNWRPERPQGQLQLTNATGQEAVVDIDGEAKLTLKPGQQLTVRKVPAGSLKLRVKTSEQTFSKGVDLPPGGHVGWRISAGRTSLIINNRYREQVTLVVDGAPRGEVSPGAIFRIDGISAGPHRVVAKTNWSKRTETATVLVRDGTRTRFTLTPPLATLRVSNPLSEPVDVVVRGLGVGTVKAGQTRAFDTDSGRLVVDVHAVKSGQSATWRGTIAPGQHLVMPTPALTGSMVIIGNPTSAPIRITLDRKPPQTVAPGQTVKLSGLSIGKHLIVIRGAGFEQRQRVQVRRGQPALKVQPLAP